MNKQFFLDTAEVIDAWRVFPRFFVLGYGVISFKLVEWAMSLPSMSIEQTSLVTIVTGLCVPMLNFYMQTGRDWKAPVSQTVYTTQRTETQEQPQPRSNS